MILALVDDLMVGVRIEEAAKAAGTSAEVLSRADAIGKLRSMAVEGIVIDLAMPRLDLDELARDAREAGAWLIAFYPHVRAELRQEAEAAGVESIYPRSRFLRDLPQLLLERLEKRA